MKTVKTSKDIINHPAVDEFFRDSDGYWIWLKGGWISPDMECGTIHEWTISDCCCKLNGVEQLNSHDI